MFSFYYKPNLVAWFAVAILGFATPGRAQNPEMPDTPGAVLADEGSGVSGNEDAARPPVVVYCVLPDDNSRTVFYAPLRMLPAGSPGRISRLSARFVRSVNAQKQRDLDVGRKACGVSPTTLAASSALNRTMAPLLSQGFVAVVVGIF